MKTICFSGISMNHYRPQTKFAKVMFSQVSLCPQGGVCHTHTPRPEADTPRAGTSDQCMLGYTPPYPVHAGIHTLLPSAFWDTPPAQCMLGNTPIPAQCMLGYSQQAGGTHPTGMHSCSAEF